jgi:hypothetical protein
VTSALVSLYSSPHANMRLRSHGTLLSCKYRGDAGLRVLDIRCLTAVVAMVPHTEEPDRYFVNEMLGLDVAFLGGNEEEMTNE